MISNTHLYGNKDGMRVQKGANILAYGLESESNRGLGLLLLSNDNIVQGMFYTNGTTGVQIGDKDDYSAANQLTLQLHNNELSQVNWSNSGGYNMLSAVVFADHDQKFFEGSPAQADYVSTAGPYAIQQIPGGLKIDSDRNVYGAQLR